MAWEEVPRDSIRAVSEETEASNGRHSPLLGPQYTGAEALCDHKTLRPQDTKATLSRRSPAAVNGHHFTFNSTFVYRFPLFIPILLKAAKRTHTSRNLLGAVVVVVVKGDFSFWWTMGRRGNRWILWLFQHSSLPYYVKWSYIHHHDDGFSEFTANGVTSGRAALMGLWALNRVLYCCLCTNYPVALPLDTCAHKQGVGSGHVSFTWLGTYSPWCRFRISHKGWYLYKGPGEWSKNSFLSCI